MGVETGSLWTIEELGAQAALALAGADYPGQPDARIRDVPDRRTIRYYTTLGLLDRPAEMRGRTALYGMKHLLQLVAIKRLQTRGHSLTEIQQRLVGATEAALRRDAQLPATAPQSAAAPAVRSRAKSDRSPAPDGAQERATSAFWSALPREALLPREATAPRKASEVESLAADALPANNSAPRDRGTLLQAVQLGDELTLLFPASRAVFDDDIEALRAAAGPLAKLLKKRRLV